MKLVIIDWDGTLVDSLIAHFDTYRIVAEKLGIKADIDSVRNMTGMTAPEIIREAFEIDNEEKLNEVLKMKDDMYINEFWKKVEPMEGAKEFLEEMNDKFILAVATSSFMNAVRPVMEKLDWHYHFIEIVARDDVEKGKPAPDMLLLVCKRAGIAPMDAVYIGDSIHDMAAAKSAGMMGIGVSTGVHSKEQLGEAGADHVFENLFEVKSFLESL